MAVVLALTTELPPGFPALAAEARGEGFRALDRMQRAWTAGENRFDAPGEGLWVASIGDVLVGMGGLNIDPYLADHAVGRVRHLYVAAAARRAGVGRALVESVIERARGTFRRLRVRTHDDGAAQFYAALGFVPATGEDQATATHVLSLSSTSGTAPGSGPDAPASPPARGPAA